ncbi:MAG TPA: glutaredoxin family protein [Blastocatellia bacterium]
MKRATELPTVTIFSRPGCHLCDVAKSNIDLAGCAGEFVLKEVNIDLDSAAREQYQYDIPVIFINGIKAFKHEVSPSDFKRKLRRLANR